MDLVKGIACQAIDLTEQKLKEINLLESEEKFHKIFDNAHIAIAIQTKDQILIVNQIWEKITGYSAEEAKCIQTNRFGISFRTLGGSVD